MFFVLEVCSFGDIFIQIVLRIGVLVEVEKQWCKLKRLASNMSIKLEINLL